LSMQAILKTGSMLLKYVTKLINVYETRLSILKICTEIILDYEEKIILANIQKLSGCNLFFVRRAHLLTVHGPYGVFMFSILLHQEIFGPPPSCSRVKTPGRSGVSASACGCSAC